MIVSLFVVIQNLNGLCITEREESKLKLTFIRILNCTRIYVKQHFEHISHKCVYIEKHIYGIRFGQDMV